MTKKLLYGLFIIVFGLVLLTGCGSTTTTDTTDKTDSTSTDTAMTDMEDRFKQYGDDFKNEFDMIKDKAEEATGAAAATLKEDLDDLGKRIDDSLDYLKSELEDNKITQDAYDDIKGAYDDVKDEIDKLGTELEEKADGATPTDDKLSYIDTDDKVSSALKTVESKVDDLGDDVKEGTDASADYVKKSVDDAKIYLDNLGMRIDKLVSDNVITEDAKKDYDDTISTLKDDLDKIEETATSNKSE